MVNGKIHSMSITTEQKNDFLFVRFTSDLISVCDGVSIKWALQQALSTGTRNIVLSVTVGSLSNQALRFAASPTVP